MEAIENQTLNMTNTVNIFIVEDDVEIAKWIKNKIEGINKLKLVGESSKFEGAFEKIVQTNPQIIVLDLKLPDGNGINILKKIKEENLKAVVMVLSMNTQAKNSCFRLGADYFFDKSQETDQFITTLQKIQELLI